KMTNKRRWDLLGLRIWSNRHAQLDNWAESKLYEFREAKAVGRLTVADLEYGRTPLMLAAERLKEQGDQELAEELLKYVVVTSQDHEPPRKRKSKYSQAWHSIFLFAERVWRRFDISAFAMADLVYRACTRLEINAERVLPSQKEIERKLVDNFARPMFTSRDRVRASELDSFTLQALDNLRKEGD
ncbi:hypothetical protein AB6E18_24640, partial [Vibrio sp. 10N.247.311.46]